MLREAAERARRALTEADTATVELVLDGDRYAAEVTASQFEEQAQGLIARLREPVLRSLRDSNIRADALSEVVLVGGAFLPVVDETPAGFPAAVLYDFRVAALGVHLVLWSVLGLVFGVLVERGARREQQVLTRR